MKLTIASAAQLATHFKSLRKAQGWSQTDLGHKLGIGQARVAQIEGEPGSISVDKLLQILHLLDAKLTIETDTGSGHAESTIETSVKKPAREKQVTGTGAGTRVLRDKELFKAHQSPVDGKTRTPRPSDIDALPPAPRPPKQGLLPPKKNPLTPARLSDKKKW